MHTTTGSTKERELLQQIIQNERITTVFQPIVCLVDGSTLGYEALSRGPQNSTLENPAMLFDTAMRENLLWELEYLCRKKAIERASEILKKKCLFVNVDPKVIYDEKFRSGITKDFISKYDINTSNIVFEITEWSFIEDYKSFKSVIGNYINQGYKIAIDDTGSGYSGLRMLAEIHPNYIKIDMELIRDIDKKAINQALIKTLNDFANSTNMYIIAEGIETINELSTLIDLGVKYGQGYLLRRPSTDFLEIKKEIKEVIRDRQDKRQKKSLYTTNSMPIGEIARFDKSITSMDTGNVVNNIFSENPTIFGIPVVNDGIPVGLIMRNNFYSHLATQYGVAVFMNRAIRLLMNKNPLIVDYNTSLADVSKIAIGRREEDLYDYIIITKNERYYGVTTIKSLLEYTTQLEINKAKHSNPLTGLPGNIIIEDRLNKVVKEQESSYVLYFDLDNFKAYNDVYGFESGDSIIIYTSELIRECIDSFEWKNKFIGHIGGDDFIAILNGSNIISFAEKLINKFDCNVRRFYSEKDESNGYIIAKNRHGLEEKFSLITISVAGLKINNKKSAYNDDIEFTNVNDISEILTTIKKKCKLNWKSCYIIE